jgi:hypothetical protein
VFGWGGSASLGFCERTVLVTRRHPRLVNPAEDGIGITIVKEMYDGKTMKMPNWVYLADDIGVLYSVAPELAPEFEHGTHLAHVEYDLGSSKGGLINQYGFFNVSLFEPVLPVSIRNELSDSEKSKGRRSIVGTGGRFKNAKPDPTAPQFKILNPTTKTKIVHSNSTTIDLGNAGQVDAHVWVLDKEGAKPNEEIANGYVTADTAIVFTLCGQRQGNERREWIKRSCKLGHLNKRMIVQIEADARRSG